MKPVKKKAAKKIAHATKNKAAKRPAAAVKQGSRKTPQTKQGKPSHASKSEMPAGPSLKITSFPLGLVSGILHDLPPATDPKILAAKLYSIKKQQTTKKNKTDSGIQKTTIASATMDPEIQQYIRETADVLKKLLKDPGFTLTHEKINSLDPDNIQRVLASLPFEFRSEGLRLYMKGIRYFGKVPFKMERSPADHVSAEDARRLFRHINCPEGPGEGRKFGLAWLDGFALEVLPPWHNYQRSYYADHALRRITRGIDLEFEMDLLLRNNTGKAADYIDKYAAMPGLPDFQRDYLKQLAEKIRGFDKLDTGVRQIAKDAFTCGILYCTKARYPGCEMQEADRWLAKESSWQWIIIFAQLRHGPTADRKELLKVLGCTNPEEYSKTGGKLAAFHPEHSRHTPPIPFSSFNKACTKAQKWLKDNDGVNAPTPQSIIEEFVHSVTTQRKKSADQRRRNQQLKSDAGQGKLARASAATKLAQSAKEEENKKIAGKRISAARIIPV